MAGTPARRAAPIVPGPPYEITAAGRAALTEHLTTWSTVVSVGHQRLAQA